MMSASCHLMAYPALRPMPPPPPSPTTEALAEWLLRQRSDAPHLPLTVSLCKGLRRAISEDRFRTGQRLPSSRSLALALGVARNTVIAVYGQLAAEGFVRAGQGSGTYVQAVVQQEVARLVTPAVTLRGPSPTPALSSRALRYRQDPLHRFWVERPFCPGQFDADLFPHPLWNRQLIQLLRKPDPAQLRCGPPGGAPALRAAIAAHVHATRGVRCDPSQVVITDGTTPSLALVVKLLCESGDQVWMEDPGYWSASRALTDLGLRLAPLALDAAGAVVPRSSPGQPAPRLAYLTPSNQFPTGVAMPLARRLAWLAHARAEGTLLLEDDYDSEFRYEGMPFPSLQGLDADLADGQSVIYLGSFSKTMYPGIRLGFLVVPPMLAELFSSAGADHDRDGDQLLQLAMARFMTEGHYAAHVRKLLQVFRTRHEALSQALHQHLPELGQTGCGLRLLGGPRGMHLSLALPEGSDDQALALACAARGVTVIPLSVYGHHQPLSGLLLSCSGVHAEQMDALLARIAPLLRAAAREPTRPREPTRLLAPPASQG
jgi:GntR family transcriptional regulator / MocR family aminotransferase